MSKENDLNIMTPDSYYIGVLHHHHEVMKFSGIHLKNKIGELGEVQTASLELSTEIICIYFV